METCDHCGKSVQNGVWLRIGGRLYKFCSTICMQEYDPTIGGETII